MKLTFDEALERINNDNPLDAKKVQAKALKRKVWVVEWHIPGCLSEPQAYHVTKADALYSACMMAEQEEGVPYGMKTALRNHGQFDCKTPMFGDVVNTVYQSTLGELLS
jgi:hypothetical protein